MKAKELMERLIDLAPERREKTVDTCKAGDPERYVRKVALCCTATPEIIRQAHKWGADLLITHEPTYHNHWDILSEDDSIGCEKRALLESTGMTLYRYHDHAHDNMPDSIATGVIQQLGWEHETYDGHVVLTLQEARTARQLAAEIQDKLGISHVKMVGVTDAPIRRIAFCVGAWEMIDIMKSIDAELYIAGEVFEWQTCEYIRDAVELGHTKSLLVLGHIASENYGMKYVATKLREIDPTLETKFLDNPEIFTYTE